jgi:polysaccharide deacetylase 2 family uncharacterized protein YibQ
MPGGVLLFARVIDCPRFVFGDRDVAADDLDTPLNSKRRGRAFRPPARLLAPLLTVVLAALVAVPAAWIMLFDEPLGGEPSAVATIDIPQPVAGSPPMPSSPPAGIEADKSGAQTVTIIDGKSGSRTQVAVRTGAQLEEPVGTAPPLDVRLSENSRHGAIPRLGPDGARPLDVYSRADPAAAARKGPQIAIVVGGLGIGAHATGDAIAKLPRTVTLAFAPYGNELTRWVTRARSAGHEILLQLPMEPFDYPDNDPGPQTLLTNLTPAQNIDRLHWFLSRLQGYVGVTNFMGGRFTSNESAFSPVLADLSARGLLYFDDGASSRSLAHKAAAAARAPFLKADLVVDAKPNWSDIDNALEQLERIAADKGSAVGTATALPVSIERIARWTKAAEARGMRLVPLSVLAINSK